MDGFLDFLGLYRSDVAKDESCLYRAVAEQLFYTQSHHAYLKQRCVEYMLRHRDLFEHMVEDFDVYLEHLLDNEEWAGPMEMTALSLMYRVDFILYQHVGEPPIKATNIGSDKQVVLAEFSGNRYDCVYTKSYLAASAICQSITYEVLYKEVFGYGEDVHLAVEKMLHDKQYSKLRKSNLNQHSKLGSVPNEFPQAEESVQEPCSDIKKALAQGIPPFPYKVAKTLDHNIYRNVEFDIWNEEKKETLRSEQFVIPSLAEGVKCKVNVPQNGKPKLCTGHVQELLDDKRITVYVEELCSRCVVKEEDIEIVPVPAYKALTWHGGKTYRVNTDDRKVEGERKSKKFWKWHNDNHWISPPVEPSVAMSSSPESCREQNKSSQGSLSPVKGHFRQYSSSFSTPRGIPKKQGYQKPRSSLSLTSYNEFCKSLANGSASVLFDSQHSSPITSLPTQHCMSRVNHAIIDTNSFSSGYHSSSSQNVSADVSDLNSQSSLNQSPPLEMTQDQHCFAQSCAGFETRFSYPPPQENFSVNSIGSAAATSLPLQIPRPAALKQVVEEGGPFQAPFPMVAPQVTFLQCSLCQPGYIICGSDGQQVPVNIWSLPAQSPVPSSDLPPGVQSVLVNTPPTGISPPVTQMISGYMQPPVLQYSTSWNPAVPPNFLPATPPTPYQPSVMTPPWSPPSNFMMPGQQPPVQCPIPNMAAQASYLPEQQPWSIQSV